MRLNWKERLDVFSNRPEWILGNDKAYMIIFFSHLVCKYFVDIEIRNQSVFFSKEGHDTPSEAEEEAIIEWEKLFEEVNYLNDLYEEEVEEE